MTNVFSSPFAQFVMEYWSDINPLSPKSDQYQISPCDINAL